MSNDKDFKVKNGIQPTVYHEAVGTVVSGVVGEAYSLANVIYDGVSFNVVGQEGLPAGLFFKPDGTKMYVVGSSGDDVNEYNLSTAWDVSTASFLQLFSVAAQELNPTGIFFKPDGTKMYVIGQAGDEVNEYNLSTAWDVSTASFLQLFSVAAQDGQPRGIFFKPDGTKMYVVANLGDDVNEYDLSTPWNISTASFLQLFSVATQDIIPYGLFFKPDGTKMYVTGQAGDNVYEYNLSTAWDVSTASFLQLFSVAAQELTPTGIFFKPDGTKMYILGSTADSVYQYSTALITAELDLSTGSVFEITPTSNLQVTLSNPAASGTSSGATLLLSGGGTTGYDLGNAVYLNTLSLSDISETSASGVFLKDDGLKLYVLGRSSDQVSQYTLSTAFDISTATYDGVSISTLGQDADGYGLFFKSDGTAFYLLGANTGKVYQYSLSTAWDVSTASYASKSFIVSSQETVPLGLFFKDDGTKMYVSGVINDTVYQYSLSTAWDVSTASYDTISFSMGSQTTAAYGLFFKSDGTKMYSIDANSDTVLQYSLSTAWNVSTASYDNISYTTSVSGINTVLALTIVNSGKTMLLASNGSTNMTSYSTATPASITYDPILQWSGGTAPTAPAIGETDVLTFNTTDGGTTYKSALAIDGAS